jgi:hypothetical protein
LLLGDKALTKPVTITLNDIQSLVRCTPMAAKQQTRSCVERDGLERDHRKRCAEICQRRQP